MYNLNDLKLHLESFWKVKGKSLKLEKGPTDKLHNDFYIVEFAPGSIHNFWIYSTIGMSLGKEEKIIELHIFSNKQDESLIELLYVTASYHRNNTLLGLHHTINFGKPWQDNSVCNCGFISLPYLDGEKLELFNFNNTILHNFWIIPISERERNFKIEYGWEKLEELFESNGLNYLNPKRKSLI